MKNKKYYERFFCYLVKRKRDNKRFIAYGNVKAPTYTGVILYNFAPETYEYAESTPYGKQMNISSDEVWEKTGFEILHQKEMELKNGKYVFI